VYLLDGEMMRYHALATPKANLTQMDFWNLWALWIPFEGGCCNDDLTQVGLRSTLRSQYISYYGRSN
jgi:hypothetical protein